MATIDKLYRILLSPFQLLLKKSFYFIFIFLYQQEADYNYGNYDPFEIIAVFFLTGFEGTADNIKLHGKITRKFDFSMLLYKK